MKGRRILLADDDHLVQKAVARAAAQYGCEIIAVLEGAKVMSTVTAERPDLIVLDLTFPDADGRQILKELRGNPDTKRTPVVIWSSYDPGPNRRIFLAAGADDYVEKSDAATLLPKIKRLLLRESAPGFVRTDATNSTGLEATDGRPCGGEASE